MTYRVRLTEEARDVYKRVDTQLAKKLVRCFTTLKVTPRRHPNIKSLKGKFAGCYRYRLGDYRVIYSVDDKKLEVIILVIAHRSEAYEL
jgi:mRNA interferase RelE/StbE